MRAVITSLMISLMMVLSANAVNPDERLSDPQLEERARIISKELRCLVCQNQSIDDSDAALARDLRILVRERLSAGDSDTQVLDYVVGRYGEFVLLKPRLGLHTIILWSLPFILVLFGILAGRALFQKREASETLTEGLTKDEEEILGRLRSKD